MSSEQLEIGRLMGRQEALEGRVNSLESTWGERFLRIEQKIDALAKAQAERLGSSKVLATVWVLASSVIASVIAGVISWALIP